MSMTIRQATHDDMATILEMGEKFFLATKYAELTDFCHTSARATADTIFKNGFILLAEQDGTPVGMIGVIVAPFILNFSIKSATEMMWWVEPNARSSRAAISLISTAIAECKARGCQWLSMSLLSSSPKNVAAYYERVGFEFAESCYLMEL